jgi:hypothetical protein
MDWKPHANGTRPPCVQVKRIWQPPTDDSVIKMRWTVRGIPRVFWESEGLFDGISTYKLDEKGRVYEHSVDNVLLRDPPMFTTPPLGVGLNLERILGGVPQQAPIPVSRLIDRYWLRQSACTCQDLL